MNLLCLHHIDEQKAGVVNHLSSVRFEDSDYARFFDLWEEGVATNLLNETMAPPAPVPAAFEDLIQGRIAELNTPGGNWP